MDGQVNSISKEIATQTTILDALQRIALMQMQLGSPDAKIELITQPKDISFDHWVASVLLDVTKAQVYFRVHFSTSVSRALLADNLQQDASDFDPSTAHDHVKEYCNVIMGKIKGALSTEIEMDDKTKVFLPQIDPSYDRFKVAPSGNEKVFEERWWKLGWDGGELILYARVKSEGGFGDQVLLSLAQEQIIIVDNAGDIELL